MERLTGYYRILYKNQWIVAFWTNGGPNVEAGFYLPGSEWVLSEGEVQKIDEDKIQMPDK